MDVTSISAAFSSLKIAKDILTTISQLNHDVEVLADLNKASHQVAQAQEALFLAQERAHTQQDEIRKLKQTIEELDSWTAKMSSYELVETNGGAVVYKSHHDPTHYICPSCVEKRERHILQDQRTFAGFFECTGCDKKFRIRSGSKQQLNL